jgi:mannan endo-1,4-beta-mannosidase
VPARSGKSGKYAFYWGTDKGKEDEQTTFDVKKIFEPTSAEYQRMINDIDRVADILLKLKQRGIPVLWRPLHEAGGMWFWWGRDPEGCNELWRTMYRRFQEKGVDNLIWVWTQGAAWNKPYSDGYRWYPGDDYVDIVGIDIYNETNATTIRTQCYDFLKQSSPTKLAALTECGSVAHIGQQWTAGARWLYFVPWYDYDVSNNTSNAAFMGTAHANADIAWWNEAFSHDYVMTRDDVKELAATAVHSPVAPVHVNANPSFFYSSLFPLYIKNGKKYIKKTNTSK